MKKRMPLVLSAVLGYMQYGQDCYGVQDLFAETGIIRDRNQITALNYVEQCRLRIDFFNRIIGGQPNAEQQRRITLLGTIPGERANPSVLDIVRNSFMDFDRLIITTIGNQRASQGGVQQGRARQSNAQQGGAQQGRIMTSASPGDVALRYVRGRFNGEDSVSPDPRDPFFVVTSVGGVGGVDGHFTCYRPRRNDALHCIPNAVLVHSYNGYSPMGVLFSADINNQQIAKNICRTLGLNEDPTHFILTIENANLLRDRNENFLLRPQWTLIKEYARRFNAIGNPTGLTVPFNCRCALIGDDTIARSGNVQHFNFNQDFTLHSDRSDIAAEAFCMASPRYSGDLGSFNCNHSRIVLYSVNHPSLTRAGVRDTYVGMILLIGQEELQSARRCFSIGQSFDEMINQIASFLPGELGGQFRTIFHGQLQQPAANGAQPTETRETASTGRQTTLVPSGRRYQIRRVQNEATMRAYRRFLSVNTNAAVVNFFEQFQQEEGECIEFLALKKSKALNIIFNRHAFLTRSEALLVEKLLPDMYLPLDFSPLLQEALVKSSLGEVVYFPLFRALANKLVDIGSVEEPHEGLRQIAWILANVPEGNSRSIALDLLNNMLKSGNLILENKPFFLPILSFHGFSFDFHIFEYEKELSILRKRREVNEKLHAWAKVLIDHGISFSEGVDGANSVRTFLQQNDTMEEIIRLFHFPDERDEVVRAFYQEVERASYQRATNIPTLQVLIEQRNTVCALLDEIMRLYRSRREGVIAWNPNQKESDVKSKINNLKLIRNVAPKYNAFVKGLRKNCLGTLSSYRSGDTNLLPPSRGLDYHTDDIKVYPELFDDDNPVMTVFEIVGDKEAIFPTQELLEDFQGLFCRQGGLFEATNVNGCYIRPGNNNEGVALPYLTISIEASTDQGSDDLIANYRDFMQKDGACRFLEFMYNLCVLNFTRQKVDITERNGRKEIPLYEYCFMFLKIKNDIYKGRRDIAELSRYKVVAENDPQQEARFSLNGLNRIFSSGLPFMGTSVNMQSIDDYELANLLTHSILNATAVLIHNSPFVRVTEGVDPYSELARTFRSGGQAPNILTRFALEGVETVDTLRQSILTPLINSNADAVQCISEEIASIFRDDSRVRAARDNAERTRITESLIAAIPETDGRYVAAYRRGFRNAYECVRGNLGTIILNMAHYGRQIVNYGRDMLRFSLYALNTLIKEPDRSPQTNKALAGILGTIINRFAHCTNGNLEGVLAFFRSMLKLHLQLNRESLFGLSFRDLSGFASSLCGVAIINDTLDFSLHTSGAVNHEAATQVGYAMSLLRGKYGIDAGVNVHHQSTDVEKLRYCLEHKNPSVSKLGQERAARYSEILQIVYSGNYRRYINAVVDTAMTPRNMILTLIQLFPDLLDLMFTKYKETEEGRAQRIAHLEFLTLRPEDQEAAVFNMFADSGVFAIS